MSGPVDCSGGEHISLRIIVSLRATGAVAQGTWAHRCTLTALHWHLTATITDGTQLSPGCAQAVGLAIARKGGKAIRSLQWLEQ